MMKLSVTAMMAVFVTVTGHAATPGETTAPSPAVAAPAAAAAPATPAAPAANAQAPVVILTRAVGEVGDRVVTSREVRINEAVEQIIVGKPATPDGYRVLTGLEKSFPSEVSRVLDEWVVYLEAKSLSSQPVSRGDIGGTMKQAQETWGAKSGWQQLEVSAEELRETIERKLIAKEFERLKSDPQLAPVSDDDALAYYRKNRLRFGSLPFSSFKDSIKSFLVKQQIERRLSEWREVLRRKYKVRNFISG